MEDFEFRFLGFLDDTRHDAHPYRLTDTGIPWVRGIPFHQTRSQQQPGRAWFSPRPQRIEKVLYPPRTYKQPIAKTG